MNIIGLELKTENFINDNWEKINQIIGHYSGSLTEFYILDLDYSNVLEALKIITNSSPNPQIICLNSFSLTKPISFYSSLINTITEHKEEKYMNIIRADFTEKETANYHIWIDKEKNKIEIELVFSNKSSFPKSNSKEQNIATLHKYLEVIYKIKELDSTCKVYLGDEHNSDPREIIEELLEIR